MPLFIEIILIFHDFPWPTPKFQDFPGLENEIIKFHDFPGFPWPVQTLNSCQKNWQNRFYVIGKQKEMEKKRHSGIFQAFWPMKVEAKSAQHVINIASEATSKKCTRPLSWNRGELGQSVNTNGDQKAIVVCIFHASVKIRGPTRLILPKVSWPSMIISLKC